MTKTVLNDEILKTYPHHLNESIVLNLCKQNYSDGTSFYTLQDIRGNWKIEHASRTIDKLIKQIEHEISVENEFLDTPYISGNPEVLDVYQKSISRLKRIVKDMEEINEQK
ncbi:hypothetical protein [Rossellomorea marisflavi]|uniref:hypothetical protein n=1 Tax=Rossellomorea marisflavi TaxID=189381 RepID=UPI00345DB3E9